MGEGNLPQKTIDQRKVIRDMENKFNENSKKMLESVMKREVTRMMEQALDFASVACPNDNFKQLRAKILRAGNNCIRTLEKEFMAYDVQYKRINEEIIEFRNN